MDWDGLSKSKKGDSAGTVHSIVDTEYDSCACSPLGKVKRVSQPYAPGGTVYWTTYTYDGLGRTTSALPDGSGTTSYIYQGNVTTVTDPAGKWKKYTTDAMGNLTKVIEPNPAGGADLDTNYTYNLFSQLTQTSMTRSSTTQTRTFTYDANQRLMSVNHPESGSVTYTYNTSYGTVATKVDAKNQKMEYVYDGHNRVTQIKRYWLSTGSETTCQRTYFYYDTLPFTLSGFPENGWGRLTAVEWYVSPSTGCTSSDLQTGMRILELYRYSVGGLVLKKRLYARRGGTWPATAGSLPSSANYFMEAVYTYNNEGQTVSVTYPGDTHTSGAGPKYVYSFDGLGRPNKLTWDVPTPVDWVKNVLYGPAGQLTQMDYSGGSGWYNETRSYNNRLQVTQIQITGSVNMQYVYSTTQNNGQITRAIDAVSGETVDYAYDSLNRLITAATTGPQWGLSFGYDGFGNRLSQTVTKGSAPASSLSVNAATNRINSGGFVYDSNGNLTTMPFAAGSTTLSYDIENRVIQAVNVNGTERYGYGPDNRRVYQKQPTGTELIHFYGVNGDRLRSYGVDGSGVFSGGATNIYFAGRRVWQNNAAVFVDRLGSNRTGSRYYPFGEEQVATANDKDKFATYSRDSSTGLDYAMNRYYGSTMGRFLMPDPYGASAKPGNPQSWNRYAYVNNDPVNKNDPSGLDPDDPPSGYPWWLSLPTGLRGRLGDYAAFLFRNHEDFRGRVDSKKPSPEEQSRERLLELIDEDCAEALGADSVSQA